MTLQAALIPAQGIGDALLMLSAAPLLQAQGYQISLYHDAIASLANWFPTVSFHKKNSFHKADLVIAQNDNTPFIETLLKEHRPSLSLFYPTYKNNKHAPLGPRDQIFNPKLPMAYNIAQATAKLFKTSPIFSNGITPLADLYFRSFLKRIIIHPTSREKEKNWKATSFVSLAKQLHHRGFFPLFIVSPQEHHEWQWIQQEGLSLRAPTSLSECASLIYESGALIGNDSFAGHLASNLGIPTLILGNDSERLKLWRPGWTEGQVLCPKRIFPRSLRLRYFPSLISVQRVLKTFSAQSRSATALQTEEIL